MRIGFIGLGNMGLPMARRLVAAGYEVLARDINDAVVTGFVEQAGASRLTDGNLGEIDVLITMLPTSAIVESACWVQPSLVPSFWYQATVSSMYEAAAKSMSLSPSRSPAAIEKAPRAVVEIV